MLTYDSFPKQYYGRGIEHPIFIHTQPLEALLLLNTEKVKP